MSLRERYSWIDELPYLIFAIGGAALGALMVSEGELFGVLSYGVGGAVLSVVLILDRRRRRKRRRLQSVGGFAPMALPSAEDASAPEELVLDEHRCKNCGVRFKFDPALDVVHCVNCMSAHHHAPRRPALSSARR